MGTLGVNVRTRATKHALACLCFACAHVYASCAGVFAWIFTKIVMVIVYYLMKFYFKFHKDRRFGCGDICKTILTCV